MSSPSKAKGTRWESACAEVARSWWPWIERRALKGNRDCGDLAHPQVVIECKADRSISDAQCLRELGAEMDNADTDVGFVWKKLHGKANPLEGVALVPVGVMLTLLKRAGY